MSKGSKKDLLREIAQELDAFDNMLTSLVEILEEKGILTQEEWEHKIRSKINKGNKTIMSYRQIQFTEEET
jgi:hypothetical protein